jgi:hypothetical protein
MLWVPRAPSDPDDVSIVLITDRRRFWISAIPLALVFVLAIAGLLIHAPPILVIVELLLIFAAYRYAAGGKSGYYEVRPDGSLGDFLGRRTPTGLSSMERMKPE